jgi:hypothetical protein
MLGAKQGGHMHSNYNGLARAVRSSQYLGIESVEEGGLGRTAVGGEWRINSTPPGQLTPKRHWLR